MDAGPLQAFFAARGWRPFAFQRRAWRAYLAGESGLLHAPTGTGKTLAVWGGPILEWLSARGGTSPGAGEPAALRVLWLTPLRALANDTVEGLRAPVAQLGLPWTIEKRTGDTPQSLRQRQQKRLPTALVTTPESLSILLSFRETARQLASLRCVIVDEWHELLGTKRGVQAELCLARLRAAAPGLRTWGLSATLGNLDEAMEALLGRAPGAAALPGAARGRLIRGRRARRIRVRTVRPRTLALFPWSGHLGLKLLPQVIEALDAPGSALLFTNTRSQAETWFHAILAVRPAWENEVGLHHGSLDPRLRRDVEERLASGQLRCVVCTSSLDLGVDFAPVDRVFQVGSPKGIARLLQRAGRSNHRPGAASCVLGVPTNAFELVEFAAARDACRRALRAAGRIERRRPLTGALDVLAQHLVTIASGDGFTAEAMREEARTTHAFAHLSDGQWTWALDFVTRGGPTLGAYPQFSRVIESGGRYAVAGPAVARRHRMAIGTIDSDAAMTVRFVGGRRLGTIEERFIGRLRAGDRFVFAGRSVELVRVREMTAYVRRATGRRGVVPRWLGSISPLSTKLARAVRSRLDEALAGRFRGPEMRLVRPLLQLQARWSRIPASGELLVERLKLNGVHHEFVFSFGGRLVHEGLAALVAHRITRARPCSIAVTGNDYGFELTSRDDLGLDEAAWRRALAPEGLLEDLLACLNDTELARRRFRGIARVAGLVFPGLPGQAKTARQLQASSDLFYDVFRDYDPGHLLLEQARREVLDAELEVRRLRALLGQLESQALRIERVPRLTPLAFPLWAESLRTQHVSSESWRRRVERMAERLELAAARPPRRRPAIARG